MGEVAHARYRKLVLESRPAVGKMCEPREKSQRTVGRERDAGWAFRLGMSKREKEAMPPEARSAVVMLRIWRVWRVDIFGVGGGGDVVGFGVDVVVVGVVVVIDVAVVN